MLICFKNRKELLSSTSNGKSEFLNTLIDVYQMLIKRNIVSRLEKRKKLALGIIETFITKKYSKKLHYNHSLSNIYL